MTKEELINKIRKNRSFELRTSEFYEPWDISDETIKDMADDFYYLLKDVLNYLVGKEVPVSEDLEEAANKYAKDYLFTPKPQRAPNIHFEAGANYVLEQIENVLNNPYQCTFKTLKANIEELVIKLKEK